MITAIFDPHVRGIREQLYIVDFHKSYKTIFEERMFPMCDISTEHIYVGF